MSNVTSTWRTAAAAVLLSVALPAAAHAQAGGGGGGGRGGQAGMAAATDMRQALGEMDLPGEEKTKVDGILTDAAGQMRQAAQDLRDADPADRRQKMADLQKMMADTKAKVMAELTPDQKTDLAHRVAGLSVARSAKGLAAEKKAVDGLSVPADQKTQATNVLDDAAKTMDGYKADADAVKDDPAATALATKVQKTMTETTKSLTDILGADDARTVPPGRQPGHATGRRRRRRATGGRPRPSRRPDPPATGAASPPPVDSRHRWTAGTGGGTRRPACRRCFRSSSPRSTGRP